MSFIFVFYYDTKCIIMEYMDLENSAYSRKLMNAMENVRTYDIVNASKSAPLIDFPSWRRNLYNHSPR